ncbi:MAG: tRNA (5-methylaminomethyl-2-thiouridylate)-methyltransferase [Candidatus Cloacimonetes bacterium]|nr:tRNA (5-methylaminomethyl-2-thiouridylate)-methyltransferase [Candidatus Cloacimonadota bacterium]
MIRQHKCIALFSGGLDSILAVKHMERLGYQVKAVFFETPFFEAESALQAAKANEIDLQVIDVLPQYLQVLENPRYGYGKNMNPCVDCHGFMFRMAAELLTETGADFLISGEVLGQRPMSQRKDAMNAVAKLSGVKDLLVRPLCQQFLADTLPIREGWVDKAEMLDIQGRGRQRQLDMAREFGVTEFQNPAGGCKLTDIKYSRKLKDLLLHKQLNDDTIKYLKYGRHFRLNEHTKLIVGRDKAENEHLSLLTTDEIVVKTVDFHGPLGIICKTGTVTETELKTAAGIVLRYNNNVDNEAEVAWGENFSLNNIIKVEKYTPAEVQELMIK